MMGIEQMPSGAGEERAYAEPLDELDARIDVLQHRYASALERLGVERAGELMHVDVVQEADFQHLLDTLHDLQEAVDERDRRAERSSTHEFIEERYASLLAERDRLQEYFREHIQLDRLTHVVCDRDFEGIERVVEEWKRRAREETDFFSITDDLGIELFIDNPAHQPHYRDIRIQFDSQYIPFVYGAGKRAAGGLAMSHLSQVDLRGSRPLLERQVNTFLKESVIGIEMEMLVHELVHIHNRTRHFNGAVDIAEVATEAHAYFSSVMGQLLGRGFSIGDVVRLLSEEGEEGGIYEIDAELAIQAVRGIATLYALGYSGSDVSAVVAQCGVEDGPGEKRIEPLQTHVERAMERRGVDDIDVQALDDIMRLRIQNERMKARIMLGEMLHERYADEPVGGALRDFLETHPFVIVAYPHDVAICTVPRDAGDATKGAIQVKIEEVPDAFTYDDLIRISAVDETAFANSADAGNEDVLAQYALRAVDNWSTDGFILFLKKFATLKYQRTPLMQDILRHMRDQCSDRYVRAARAVIGDPLAADITYRTIVFTASEGSSNLPLVTDEDRFSFDSDLTMLRFKIQKIEALLGLTFEQIVPGGDGLMQELMDVARRRGYLA